MSAPDIRPLPTLITEFNSTYKKLVLKLEKKTRLETELANLDRLRKRVALLKDINGPGALIAEACPFFLKYSERILDPDASAREAFFLTMNVRAEYIAHKGKQPKAKTEFAFELADSIRNHYQRATVTEKAELYADVILLLQLCIEYKLHTCA